tara:strand:+ start:666 stop:884 length:219 start_codon:yes stop_codon:yes gene_type:complete
MLSYVEKYASQFGFEKLHESDRYKHYVKREGHEIVMMLYKLHSKYVTFIENHVEKKVKASDLALAVLYNENV